MARLTVARRLSIMSQAVAVGEDRSQGVTLDELCDLLGEARTDVEESLEPLRWVEFRTPSGIVNRIDWITLEDDVLYVDQGWWRRLGLLTPAEAARLYIKAAAAASLGNADTPSLRSAMAKLRRIVQGVTVIEGELPAAVQTLRSAKQERKSVVVSIGGHHQTMVTSDATFDVVEVYREGGEWMVTFTTPRGSSDLEMRPGDAFTIPLSQVVAILESVKPAEEDSNPTVFNPRPIVATVEYPADRDWVVDLLNPVDRVAIEAGRRRATVTVWGIPELRTLMLRLGPTARVMEPADFADLGAETAAQILALYT